MGNKKTPRAGPGFGPSTIVGEDEVVISGISGRFPESDNLAELEKNLFEGINVVTGEGRWPPKLFGLPVETGKIKNLDKFDATAFGVHGKQAERMDPQLRMLIESTFEAIVDAGINPATIRGSRTGVYVGAAVSESADLWTINPDHITGYELLGTCRAMFANRISYTFDLQGPSFAMDTGCSSSIIALNEAVQAIRMGVCDAAIVGGVNLCLHPHISLQFQKLNMIGPDGKCKVFDAAGDGYARSEAAVAMYIQRKSTALRSYATIVHVKTNSDGYKEMGVTFPSGKMQRKLLQEIYAEAHVDPGQVEYIEAHGTGTRAGDIEEMGTIYEFFCKNRTPNDPLLIGSVKSNIGHSETASGLCSLAKVIVAMRTGIIPGNLHFNSPNPEIPSLMTGQVRIVDKNTPWSGGLVGMNSFGFGGSNCHVILQKTSENNELTTSPIWSLNGSARNYKPIPVAVPFSGRTIESVKFALKEICNIFQYKEGTNDIVGLVHQIFRQDVVGHSFRGYALIHSGSGGDNNQTVDIDTDSLATNKQRPLWFILTGMGSQYPGMGQELMRFKSFEKSIRNSAKILKTKGFDLLTVIENGMEKEVLENVQNCFVAIVAVQIGLVDVLKTLGLAPDGMLGHSVGELTAAYCDGAMTAHQTVLTAHARGQAILDSNFPSGAMASVGFGWEEAKQRCPPNIYPACKNSKDNITVAGPVEAITNFVADLKNEGIFGKIVNSSGLAAHSPYIEGCGPRLRKLLKKIIPAVPLPRSSRWISTSIPETEWESALAQTCSVDYHINNLMSPVLFLDALAHVHPEAVVVEVASSCILQAILKKSLPSTCTNLGLLHQRSNDHAVHLLKSIGKLYNLGFQPDFSNLYPKIRFPVATTTPSLSPLVQWDHSVSWGVAKYDENKNAYLSSLNTVDVNVDTPKDEFYVGHQIDDRILLPATGYLVLVWEKFAKLNNVTMEHCPVVFENVQFRQATILNGGGVKLILKLSEDTGEFQMLQGNQLKVTGIVRTPNPLEKMSVSPSEDNKTEMVDYDRQLWPLNKMDIYKKLRLRGYDYSGQFESLDLVDNECNWAESTWMNNWVTFLDGMLQFSILDKNTMSLFLPSRFQKVLIDPQNFVQQFETHDGHVNSNKVTILRNGNMRAVRWRGIEFTGLEAILAPKQQKYEQRQSRPLLEEYIFTHYFDSEEDTSLQKRNLKKPPTLDRALRFCVDVMLENFFALNFKIVEVVIAATTTPNEVVVPNPVSLLIEKHILSNPYVNCDITLMTNVHCDPQPFENSRVTLLTKEDGEATVSSDVRSNCHLVIVHDPAFLQSASDMLLPQGFLIYNCANSVNTGPLEIKETAHQLGCHLVGHKIYHGGCFLVFRKFRVQQESEMVSLREPIFIEVTHTSFDWVTQLSDAMRQSAAESESDCFWRIYLTSQNCPDSGIVGLTNSLRLEPGGHRVRTFFVQIHDEKDDDMKFNWQQPCQKLKEVMSHDLVMNIYRSGVWGSYRWFNWDENEATCNTNLSRITTDNNCQHAYVNILVRGDLSSLRWFKGPLKYIEGDASTRNICKVHYAALNFRDVLLATGTLPVHALQPEIEDRQESILGLEFSGIKCSTGQRVMGVVEGWGLATIVNSHGFTWNVPDDWTMSQAATVPAAYATAFYALLVRGQMCPEESILIHSGAGAVGQASIAIALSLNCKVFVTVGSQEKREFLVSRFPQLSLESSFANSHDSTFEAHIMNQTHGRGVDLVLNSLAGDQFQASIRCVARRGRFLEIGKVDLVNNTQVGAAMFLRSVTFHGVLLDDLLTPTATTATFLRDKQLIAELVQEGILAGVVQPLPITIFGSDQIEDAFRYMSKGSHIGKVAIRLVTDDNDSKGLNESNNQLLSTSSSNENTKPIIPRTYFQPQKSYIIIGGLGGFGLELARWLIERGARKLVLVSRSGITTGYQDYYLTRWRRESKVTILTPTDVDITTFEGTKKLLTETVNELGGPTNIGGIFNLGMVLSMDLIENQTPERFALVCAPKVNGTIHLDNVSRELAPKLDYFVTFSSVASGRGILGQTNYSFANSFMERICERRQRDGFHGLAIAWGAIGDAGFVAESMGGNNIVVQGSLPQRIYSCLQILDKFLQASGPVLCSFILAPLARSRGSDKDDETDLLHTIIHILGINDVANLNDSTTLVDLGIDSLMAVEVKQFLERDKNVTLVQSEIRDLTIGKLRQLGGQKLTTENKKDDGRTKVEITPVNPNPEPIKIKATPLEATTSNGHPTNSTKANGIDKASNGVKIMSSSPSKGIHKGSTANGFEKGNNGVKFMSAQSNDDKTNLEELVQKQKIIGPSSSTTSVTTSQGPDRDHKSILNQLIRRPFLYLFFTCLTLITLLVLLFSCPIRSITKLYLKLRYGNSVKLMDRNLDPLFSLESNPNFILSIKCQGQPNKQRLISIIQQRLINWTTTMRLDGSKEETPYKPYESLQWKIDTKNFLFPCWQLDSNFDVANHIIFDQSATTTSDNLDTLANKMTKFYFTQPLNPDKPQWEFRILSTTRAFSRNSEFVLMFVVHHSYGDAWTVAQMFEYALADVPVSILKENLVEKKNHEKLHSNLTQTLGTTLSNIGYGKMATFFKLVHWQLLELITMYETKSSHVVKDDAVRVLHKTTLDLSKFRRVRRVSGKTENRPYDFNTVFFACLAKAYEQSYKKAGQRVPKNVSLLLPHIMHPSGRLGLSNNITHAHFSAPTMAKEGESVQDRLESIDKSRELGYRQELLDFHWFAFSLLSLAPTAYLRFVRRILPAFVFMLSSVPSHTTHNFTICGGFRIIKTWGIFPNADKTNVNIGSGVISGIVDMALTADEFPAGLFNNFFVYFSEELERLGVN